MAILSYNLSPNLEKILSAIETSRTKLLLTPIPPRTLLRLNWESTLNKIYWSLTLTGTKFTKPEMATFLAHPEKKRLNDSQKEVLNYKKALDYIRYEWLISPRRISTTTILHLYELACRDTLGPGNRSLQTVKKNLDHVLDYLQTGNVNPIIQAGIANIQLLGIGPFEEGNGRVARLLVYVFLYKYGYDFRGLLALDEFFRRDLVALRSAIGRVQRTQNLTLWLEYFATGILTQADKALKKAQNAGYETSLSARFWKLSDRQKQILLQLDQPGTSINNKKVQQMFKVSQITASRDLAKLVTLELLFVHGKGRSVYYTKV